MKKPLKFRRLLVLFTVMLFTNLAQAQIESGEWINYKYSLIKTYSPPSQSINMGQLVTSLNNNIKNVVEVSFKYKDYSVLLSETSLKKIFATGSMIGGGGGNNAFEDLYYHTIPAEEKIKLWKGCNRSSPNCIWGVDLPVVHYLNEQCKSISFEFASQESAQDFAENMYYILHVDSHNPEQLALFRADSIQFCELAAKYREMDVKPTVTEEQRKYIVQANALNEEKRYSEALELYKKAIEIHPTSYPSAYYNMALIAAQIQDYRYAIYNMKKYLMLTPSAEDARAAQDKIYIWELKL